MKLTTFVMTATLAVVAGPAFAQVDYDHIRGVQDIVERLFAGAASIRPGATPRKWSIHDEEDTFIRETRRYVVGHGKQGVLFIVVNCESVVVLFRDDSTVFGSGKVESIWDDGGIVEHQFDDRDSMLVNVGTDWLSLLTAHDALRVRLRGFPEAVASDEFNLQEARIPGLSGGREVPHVRELFSEIGCAFE